jgi:hypothetical protein
MHKKYITIITMLVLVILGGTYKFVFQGATSKGSDGRTAINLTVSERDLVLEEMRGFLISVQQITQGISEDDMQKVTKAAKAVGGAAQQSVPGSLMGKLPLAFKKLGFDTHDKFDALALDSGSLGDGKQALKQLTILMKNCVACHEIYKLEAEGNN